MPTALLSVSEKSEIATLARGLADRGWDLVSTGGTASTLKDAGLEVISVEEITGVPDLFQGRVKTLHPAIHAGILARRSVPEDLETLADRGMRTIDLVAVNLYPFRETVARSSTTFAQALEQIDIGGPTLLRAAAKNHSDVWVVCEPEDYSSVLAALDDPEGAADLRRAMAAKVFRHVAGYDAAVAAYLEGMTSPQKESDLVGQEGILLSSSRVQGLRYGENPDQRAAFHRDAASPPWGLPALEQLQGKELSYNNLLDLDGAMTAIAPFLEEEDPACVILKHTTPCGIAVARSALEAYRQALACDPVSAFGSVVAFSQPVTESAAELLAENFVECLLAPGYAGRALKVLGKKKNLRILRPADDDHLESRLGHLWPGVEARGVRGGLLVQSAPIPARPKEFRGADETEVATAREPSEEEWSALAFAWAGVQAVKSNAILLARGQASIGIGAGQMSRVDSVRLAVEKARNAGHDPTGAVLASDAFFPFRDGIDAAAEAGVTAVVQPGGSIRDSEVVAAANERGLAMVLTGRRLFRH